MSLEITFQLIPLKFQLVFLDSEMKHFDKHLRFLQLQYNEMDVINIFKYHIKQGYTFKWR